MLHLNPRIAAATSETIERRQPRRLQIALALLLVALAFTIARDHQFWFGGSDDSDVLGPEVAAPAQQTAETSASPSVPAPTAKKHTFAKSAVEQGAPQAGIVAAKGAGALPLGIEVVTDATHHTLRPASNAPRLEIGNAGSALRITKLQPTAVPIGIPTNAAERELITTNVQPQQELEANYPLLAQQMRVQGSVVLQALIGTDGVIQDIRVLSGPSILASAAQQAVRQWRFKPYLQGGQAVETQARITVNFTIKVADNSPRTS